MNLVRLKMLEDYAREQPSDPFNIYALALEYQSSDVEKARELFDQLLAFHPGYLPSYYHAGRLYWELGLPEKAIEILKTGAEKAKAAGDRKAEGEIRSLIESLE